MAHTSQLTLNELPKKIKNEKKMARELNEIFRQMSDDLTLGIAATGVIIPFTNFNKDMESIVRTNYRRTSRDFKFTSRDRFDIDRDTDAGAVDTGINSFIDRNAPLNSSQIMSTTSDVARKAEREVRLAAEDEGRSLSNTELATLVGINFAIRNKKRTPTIAQTEIQNIAEESKDIEGRAIVASGAIKADKVWDAILDSKTRPAHARADGQVRPINEAFDVGGERLKRPGDSSLGATLGNIINCRCSSHLVKKR